MARKHYDAPEYRDLRELVDRAAKQHGDQIAYSEYGPEHTLIDHTFSQLKADSEALGAALNAAGLNGRHFALVGESTYSYVMTYFAIVNWVGVVVPIDRELPAADIAKLISKSDAEGLFHSQALADDIPEIRSLCPQLKLAVNITEGIGTPVNAAAGPDRPNRLLAELVEEGRQRMQRGETAFLQQPLDPGKMSTIIFTSGTTGANKGVMLSHRNLVTEIKAALSIFKLPHVSFSVLPINHSYEFNIHVLCGLAGGMHLCFNDSIKHVKENLVAFKPEMSLMVPMIVEALYRNIWKEAEKSNLTRHLKYGIWFSNAIRKIGIDKRDLFFNPIHQKLGGNLKIIVSGGAPLNPMMVKGFDDIGITVCNGYGITECAPLVTANTPDSNHAGTVGQVVPGCVVRIGDLQSDGTGEIQVKGANVMLGYYKDEEATRRTFTEDGWFRTGDIGYISRKGDLYITGRAKNLIILANGKNVSPEELEEQLSESIPYVREVVVFAPKNAQGNDDIIAASFFLDKDYVDGIGLEAARANLEADVARLNRRLAAYKQIKRILVRETEFAKTTTKKIKRSIVMEEAAENA